METGQASPSCTDGLVNGMNRISIAADRVVARAQGPILAESTRIALRTSA